jgi:hypothetical protein
MITSCTATRLLAEILARVGRVAAAVAAFVEVVVAFYCWVQVKLELIWLLLMRKNTQLDESHSKTFKLTVVSTRSIITIAFSLRNFVTLL